MEKEFQLHQALKSYLGSALDRYADFTWAYVVIAKKEMVCRFNATNYPDEWVNYYQENNLQRVDPVVLTSLNRLTPFAWDEKISIDKRFALPDIFEKAKKYKVIQGHTFVLHDYQNNLATLSIITDPDRKKESERCINAFAVDLDLLTRTAHEKYLALSQCLPEPQIATAHLTQRENDVLYWASMGKTYSETGIILGIKTTTVKFHMKNIVRKLGVSNARHAVRLGMELRLMKSPV